jgi:glycosyltransferase involved in cell wall biosynthesis
VIRVLAVAALPETLNGFVAPVAAALKERGILLSAVSGGDPQVLSSEFDRRFGVTSFRRAGLGPVIAAARGIGDIVHRGGFNGLYLHTPYGIAIGRLVARQRGCPHLAVVHGTLLDGVGKGAWAFSVEERLLGRLTSDYVCVNHEDADSYRAIAPSARVSVAPCGGMGISVDRLSVKPSPARTHPKRILVLGRLAADKNLDLAVSTFRALRVSHPSVELHVVGSALAGDEGWQAPDDEGIHTREWTADVAGELAEADVVFLPSLREGMSMVAAESLVAGCPVVAVSNRGTREVARGALTGIWLVEPSAQSSARAIEWALANRVVQLREGVRQTWDARNVVAFHADEVVSVLGGDHPQAASRRAHGRGAPLGRPSWVGRGL